MIRQQVNRFITDFAGGYIESLLIKIRSRIPDAAVGKSIICIKSLSNMRSTKAWLSGVAEE